MSFFPPVSSYDIHIYYHHRDQPSRKEAIELKNLIVSTFKEELDNDRIILKVLRDEQIRGPHITSFYEVDIEDPLVFVKFLSWIQLNHGSLSVLIHPNSDDTHKDHTINAAWLGDKLPLLDYMLKGIEYDANFGFPSRDLIYRGFYEDSTQFSKSIMIRLLEQGPEDDFYDKETT